MTLIPARYQSILIYWWPAIASSAVAWVMFLSVGNTPIIRASGLGLVILGVTLTLRRYGAILAITGGLALAFCPAFWSQTGGGASERPATVILALMAAAMGVALMIYLSKRPYLALGIGMFIFSIIFWSQISTPRSLRLTGLLTAWLLFLMVDALNVSNPRPDGPPPQPVDVQHQLGILILLVVGVLNDPLFVLMSPAVMVGLWLSRSPLPTWYWLVLLAAFSLGLRGIAVTYIDGEWWSVSAIDAHQNGAQIPFLIASGWRAGIRWVDLIQIIVEQYTIVGAALSVLGLARMSRWYPVLGIVLMIAFAGYAAFGLAYFGPDREILLIPLFIIQAIWLTYAVYTFGQWVEKSLAATTTQTANRARWFATSAYILLPIYLFFVVIQ